MTELVGRESELETLDRLVREVGEGEFRLLQIEGEPGIGKSRLLGELAERTSRDGWLVLRGSAAEFESELPFGPVIDALDAYLKALDPQTLNRLGPETAEVLAGVFPSLADFRSETRGTMLAAERFRIHVAIRELLERLSGRAPLLLVLDDLHWADQASTELASYLIRRPPQAGILVATSNRLGLLDPGLAATIRTSRGPVEQMMVTPLTLEQTAELAGAGPARAEQLYSETGGNPFYVLELTRAGIDPMTGQAVPDTVAGAIESEVASLGSGSRRFAEAAAVAGDPFDIDLTAVVAGDEIDPTSAVDELTSGGLVRPTEIPRRFSFRHPLVRSAIYESVMPGTRLADHERAAGALAEMAAPPAEQARHLVLAAGPGDRDSAEIIGQAAAEAQASAPRLAASWSDAALRIMPPAESEFQLEMLGVKAGATAAMGRFEEARAALLQGIDLLDREQTGELVSLTTACASLEELLGQHDAAYLRLTGLVDELEQQGSPQTVEVMLSLAKDSYLRNDADEMTRWSVRALELAESQAAADPENLAVAQATRAICASFTGPVEESRRMADAATKGFAAMDDQAVARNVDGLVSLCGADLYLERFDETIAHGLQAIDAARRSGQGQHFPMLYPCIGTAATTTGQFDVAREVLDSAIDAARLSDNVHSLSWSLFNRAALALAEGDVEMADSLSKESLELMEDQDESLIKMWSGVMRSDALDASGERELAIAQVVASAGPDLEQIPGSWGVGYLLMVVDALLALDRKEEAARYCDLAEVRAAEFENSMGRSKAFRARSNLSLAQGDPESAAESARNSLAAAEEVGAFADAGMARVSLAAALRDLGDEEQAVAELKIALGSFQEHGAKRLQKIAEQRLRSLGQRIHRRSGGASGEVGVDSLTGREREVVELVVDRRTNREIAETLFLSQKTVETHLRNIFAKLGVSTRVEAARAFEAQVG